MRIPTLALFFLLVTVATSRAQEPAAKFLVVAPEKFTAALAEFIEFKQTQLPTQLESLETILAASEGVDDPEKLKRHLHAAWRDRNVRYVLLVGDVDCLPVRYMVLDRADAKAFNYAFYPSDLYYSDLVNDKGEFDDWNANKEDFHAHYFGEVRGEFNKEDPINFDRVDFHPDVAVGRWPVSTVEELEVIAAKSIAHEKRIDAEREADESAPPTAALVAVGGWIDSRGLMQQLADQLDDKWTIERRYYADRRQDFETPPPTSRQVRGLFDQGARLILHAGHGQPNAWERCFSYRDLERLEEVDSIPIVYSASCSSAHFATLPPYEPYVDVDGVEHKGSDRGELFTSPPPPPAPYQQGPYDTDCLAERLLTRKGSGAVAYIGCNTGSQPCGLTLMRGFVEAVANSDEPRLGDCWSRAITFYHAEERLAELQPNRSWYPASIFFQPMKFMLFGDPTLRVSR